MEARKEIFGSAEENVHYTLHVKNALIAQGHHVSIKLTKRKETLKNVKRLVVAEELMRLKMMNQTMGAAERKDFANKWIKDNEDLLVSQLGAMNQGSDFVHGIFFAPSFTKATVPHLQPVFMADACHLNFGKYTLFSCYGRTANANMSPVAFAIVFGNENGTSWSEFWKYAVELHPSINAGHITIITDQDKGQMTAIAENLSKVGHFHCSHHRRANIIKNCGGGGGKTKYTALWCYQAMLNCRTVKQIEAFKAENFKFVKASDLKYLCKLLDTSLYPAARCAMRDDIYLFHLQASSGAESMNSANFGMRQRSAVDINNAMLLLVELECNRYRKQQADAWSTDIIFSRRGEKEFDETFQNLNHSLFRIIVNEREGEWVCLVKRIEDRGPERTVTLPKEPVRGSYFGLCTCGVDRRDAVPCEHMAALAASSRVPGVTRHNIMPYWWMRSHWRRQIPQDLLEANIITIGSVKSGTQPDRYLRYCPDWTANNKSGRPKKDARKKSVLEGATGKKGEKRASGVKRARRYCQSCGMFNHVTNDCWNLPSNAHKRPAYFAMRSEVEANVLDDESATEEWGIAD
jgi:hypothetical protein